METDQERAERELAERLNEEAASRIKNDPENKKQHLKKLKQQNVHF